MDNKTFNFKEITSFFKKLNNGFGKNWGGSVDRTYGFSTELDNNSVYFLFDDEDIELLKVIKNDESAFERKMYELYSDRYVDSSYLRSTINHYKSYLSDLGVKSIINDIIISKVFYKQQDNTACSKAYGLLTTIFDFKYSIYENQRVVWESGKDVVMIKVNKKALTKISEYIRNNLNQDIYLSNPDAYDFNLSKKLFDLTTQGRCVKDDSVIKVLKELKISYRVDVVLGAINRIKLFIKRLKDIASQKLQYWQLQQLQGLPLEIKIAKTKQRIIEWYEHWEGNVYVSFSGGLDSTVLAHLVRSIYPDVPLVFVDTGLEFPKIRSFALKQDNLVVLKPSLSFKQVIEKYGYPVVSKSQAMAIRKIRTQNLSEKYRNKLLYGDEKGTAGKLSNKHHYLLEAPFPISEQCCEITKKNPIHKYEKETGRKPYVGTMADESQNRTFKYLKTGCNSFLEERPKSQPLGFWTNQDKLRYIKDFNVDYSQEYGDIIEIEGKLDTTEEKRTGCMFCLFGCQYEKPINRFQRMEKKYPQLHEYCMEKLGLRKVMEYMNLPYKNEEDFEPILNSESISDIQYSINKKGQLSFLSLA